MAEPLKHIDSDSLPTEQLRQVWEAIQAKQFTDLLFLANLLYIASWSVKWLKERKENGPIFGEAPEEAEFCDLCGRIIDWAQEQDARPVGSAIGAWLVQAMLLALLNRLLREFAEGGALPDWLADFIERVKEQIEAL